MYKLLLCVLFSLGAAQHVQQNDGPTTEEQQHATRMCNLDNSLRPGVSASFFSGQTFRNANSVEGLR